MVLPCLLGLAARVHASRMGVGGVDFDVAASPGGLLFRVCPQPWCGTPDTHVCMYVMYVCLLIYVRRLMSRDSYLKKLFENKMPL